MSDLVTVIIPTFKGCDSIGVALESVFRQTYNNIEVIVSDDNYNDGEREATSKVVESFKNKLNIRHLINEHVNGSHARNQGLKNANGMYICFLDDDDFFWPTYIEKAVQSLNDFKNVDIVFFDVSILTREAVCRVVTNDSIGYKDILLGKKEIGTGSNLFFRRKVYDETEGFDERYLRFQDLEFAAKKLYKYESVWVKENLIVKYYNSTDNYLNYKKSLEMQRLFRDDIKKRNMISDLELQQMENIQLHNLYKDMLVKNMDVTDIEFVLSEMDSNNTTCLLDNVMHVVYLISPSVFNCVYNLYMHIVYGDEKVLKAEYLLDYYKELKEAER